jgi:NADP-dependent 3-hydroxy acid dehydrogenase YdfG
VTSPRSHPRVALITGAGAGIGRGLARKFAAAGVELILNDIDGVALQETVTLLQDSARVYTYTGDVAQESTVQALMQYVDETGRLDALVNNAGLTRTYKPFLETTLEDWDRIMAVNLRAVYHASLTAARYWVRNGQPGCIVNISSPGASRAHHDNSLYDASKGGIDALTRAMAVDLGSYRIRVVLTEFMRNIPVELEESARIDGAGEFTLFARIILPLAKPALGTVVVFSFIMVWDQYLLPLIVATDPSYYTLPVALIGLRQEDTINVPTFMAAAFITMIPSVLVYLAMQRFFERGLTSGSVKG